MIPRERRSPGFRALLNPAGPWTAGGPKSDTGLTGRKIIVDTYGGSCPHGGGAFSGKDPSKVDRSGAYAARWVARHVVAAGLARRCTLQLAYAIGVAEPVSVSVDTHGTGSRPESEIEAAVREVFDLTPSGIIRDLDLQRPIYTETSSLGHFGPWRDPDAHRWERLDRAIRGFGRPVMPHRDRGGRRVNSRDEAPCLRNPSELGWHYSGGLRVRTSEAPARSPSRGRPVPRPSLPARRERPS